jgi:ribose transport system substrate-binding protein
MDGALAGFRADGMTFVGSVDQQRNNIDNAAGGQAVMRAILAKYPNVRGVLAYNDDSVAGAIGAAKSAGDAPGKKILFVSRNGEPQAIPLIKQGELLATCDINPIGIGEDAAQAAIDQILGRKHYDGNVQIPPPKASCLVDQQNVGGYQEWDQRIPYAKITER